MVKISLFSSCGHYTTTGRKMQEEICSGDYSKTGKPHARLPGGLDFLDGTQQKIH